MSKRCLRRHLWDNFETPAIVTCLISKRLVYLLDRFLRLLGGVYISTSSGPISDEGIIKKRKNPFSIYHNPRRDGIARHAVRERKRERETFVQ